MDKQTNWRTASSAVVPIKDGTALSASVTIVIPVCEGELLIGRCLQSVLKQQGDCRMEVLVVDDGSTDRTVQVVQNVADDRITVVRQENQGPAAARNAGLFRATGRYVAFLDADDYWMPTFLQHTVGFLEAHPEAVAVSVGQVHRFPGRPDHIVPQFPAGCSCACGPHVLDSFFDFWAQYNHVCTGSVLVRREVARQTGGQRTEFRICEDLEFWAYLATFGKWGFIPEVLFVSDGGAIIRRQGWLAKNRRRWASAPTVQQWQQRIVPRLAAEQVEGFRRARARVARNLAHAMILSGRDRLARQTVAYFRNCPVDKLGRWLRCASAGGFMAWTAMCRLLRAREWWRDRPSGVRAESRRAEPSSLPARPHDSLKTSKPAGLPNTAFRKS